MLIYVTLVQFQKIFRQGVSHTIFESKKRVIGVQSGYMLCAFKVTKDRIYKDSIPITGVGYPGIATADDKAAMTHDEIVEEIRGLLEDLEDEERSTILKKVENT